MGVQAIISNELRPALTAAAIPDQLAAQLCQCEAAYRAMVFVVLPGAENRSQQTRPLEVIVSDLIVRLEDHAETVTGVQVDALLALQSMLYARLAMISAFRHVIAPDVEPTDNALVLDLIDVAESRKAVLVDQIDAELTLLRKLVEAHNEIRDVQWMPAIVVLTEAKSDFARIRKLPFCRTYASFPWMASYLALLVARANLFFNEIMKAMPGGCSNVPPALSLPLPNLIRKPEFPLTSQIESCMSKSGALCACLIHDGLDADSKLATMRGYQFPEDVERPSGLRSWSCIFSCSSTTGFNLDSHMANIVCLLMEYGQHFGVAALHREPGTAISYLYMPVEIRVFLVVIWSTPQLARSQAQFTQTWTALGKSIRAVPYPSQATFS